MTKNNMVTALITMFPLLIAIIAYFLDKQKQKTFFIEQTKNENFNKYSEYLVELMAQIVVEYNPKKKEEVFDPEHKEILLPLLKLFGHFDSLYARKQTSVDLQKGMIRDDLFKYWDETINLMMKETFYQNAWNYIKQADYYSEDFISLMDAKVLKYAKSSVVLSKEAQHLVDEDPIDHTVE